MCSVEIRTGKGETMLSQDLIVVPTQGQPPAIIQASGRKAPRLHRALPACRHWQILADPLQEGVTLAP